MKHDPLCIHERHHTCICGELKTARVEERAKILADSEAGEAYRRGRIDAAMEVRRMANMIPDGVTYDPIWTALSAAADAIDRNIVSVKERTDDEAPPSMS